MSILDILNELEAEPSTNAKVAILEREKNNELLKRVFQATYNPMITYGIKKIPEYDSQSTAYTLDKGIDELLQFASRRVTGNEAIKLLAWILKCLSKDDAIVLERIIQRDLRCGTSDSLASRVWPGLVPVFDVMLSHKDISGIKFPAYAQIKSDGARCHMSLQAGKGVAFSRNGKPIELHGVFDVALRAMINDGETLDGELLAVDKSGKILERKVGNGIVNKAVKGTISIEEAKSLIFCTWDIVDFSSTVPYSERITRLTDVAFGTQIRVLATLIVKTKEDAQKFFEKCLDAGEEGAMIKNMNHVWQPKRTKECGKLKAEKTADLIIVDVFEGEGKYAGMLGGFICETSDGLLQVRVGSGFSDAQRKEFWNMNMKGTIVEVMYNAKITSKSKEKASLFLPRFLSIRFDKDIANTLEELK